MFLDDEVVTYDARGRFVSTEDGSAYVKVRFQGIPELQSLRQFRRQLFQADLIGRTIRAEAIVGPGLEDLPPPPSLKIRATPDAVGAIELVAEPYPEVSEIRLFANGAPVAVVAVPKEGLRTTNTYNEAPTEAIRVSASGAESNNMEVHQSGDLAPLGRLFVLSLGVSDYFDARIPDLRFAASDAAAFCRTVLTSKDAYANKIDLSGGCDTGIYPSTSDIIREAIQDMTARDTMFLFLSGHGIRDESGEFYFLRQDTNLDRLKETSSSWSEILSSLRTARGRVFIFLDACHSGQAGRLLANDDLVTGIRAVTDASVFVLAASKGRQRSYDDGKAKGGYFALSVERLLSSRSGPANNRLGSFYRALKAEVMKATADGQTPWLSSTFPLRQVTLY